jgi:hypothetical protein
MMKVVVVNKVVLPKVYRSVKEARAILKEFGIHVDDYIIMKIGDMGDRPFFTGSLRTNVRVYRAILEV